MTVSPFPRGAVVTLTDGTTGHVVSGVMSRGRVLVRPRSGGLPLWVPVATLTTTD